MSRTRCFETALLSLGLTVGLLCGTSAQAAEPMKPTPQPAAVKPAAAISAAKAELPFPNGEKWVTATEREKLAYLLGITNMAMAEYQLTGPAPKYRTLVPKMVQALDGSTLRQMMGAVDTYYKANSDQQKRSIFEVIWFEVVAPKADALSQKPNPPAAKK